MPHEQVTHLKSIVSQLASSLRLAFDSFLVSREAMRATPRPLAWYRRMLGAFLKHLDGLRITTPSSITPHHIRTFIVTLERRGLKDNTIHCHARAVKTFVRFLHAEGIIDADPMQRVAMPRLDKRILPALSPDAELSLRRVVGQQPEAVRD